MKSLVQARLKRSKALELAADGLPYEQIARRAGYAHRGSAHRAVFKALAEVEAENAEQLRQLEVDRLDELQAGLWEKAVSGDLAAATSVLRIIDLRSRLLGLQVRQSGAPEPELATLVLRPTPLPEEPAIW
ncbi:hypothetical protein G5V58_03950 [Nocardioides anomalus]|uniref:Uncharacterized protein n=1 Tax=Nocardioides anomalus TaxID=2712223 RepID=A0A6G6W9Z1_9ACTN|nr:hypothetical protein [Nocardioides anomalus]QIG42036.1 hypothetical protein G5V58_03950 [Nocardioides anomalus]